MIYQLSSIISQKYVYCETSHNRNSFYTDFNSLPFSFDADNIFSNWHN